MPGFVCFFLGGGALQLISVGWEARTAVLHCRGCWPVGATGWSAQNHLFSLDSTKSSICQAA